MTDDRGQKSENKGQKSENRGQKSECGLRQAQTSQSRKMEDTY